MTTVYIVTDGEESGHSIRGTFSTKAAAEHHQREGGYASVEAWELDSEQGKKRRFYYDCGVDMETGEIVHRSLLPSRLWALALPCDLGYTQISTGVWYNKGRATLIAYSYESLDHAVQLATDTWKHKLR